VTETNSALAGNSQPSSAVVPASIQLESEACLIDALRAGDECAFAALIDTHHAPMLRIAKSYVRDRSVAEEVVQEAWLGVLRSIHRFERRSTLKTWIFRILVNVAKARAAREERSVPFSALIAEDSEEFEPAVDADRFLPVDAQWPGHWLSFPLQWGSAPDERVIWGEAQNLIASAIEGLSPGQREVVTLRDVNDWTSEEVCNVLQISETNQRVLLHRGRSRIRRELERYFIGA
jgi:RNA polymerase sigma-70 factor, ECF subfamily